VDPVLTVRGSGTLHQPRTTTQRCAPRVAGWVR
jgi:hypothetical protein